MKILICVISLHVLPPLSLQGTLILKFLSIPDREKSLDCSIDGLELFSCSLSNEDETALSILDPVSITVEIKPPEEGTSGISHSPGERESGRKESVVRPQVLEVCSNVV